MESLLEKIEGAAETWGLRLQERRIYDGVQPDVVTTTTHLKVNFQSIQPSKWGYSVILRDLPAMHLPVQTWSIAFTFCDF